MQPDNYNTEPEQPLEPEQIPVAADTIIQQEQARVSNSIWSKQINRTNLITAVIVLLLLILIDLPMAMSSWTSLGGFFQMMLLAFGIFSMCAFYEYVASLKLRNSPPSKIDNTMLTLANLRNSIVILNVIPLVQLLGILAAFIAPFIVVAQLIMVSERLRRFDEEG